MATITLYALCGSNYHRAGNIRTGDVWSIEAVAPSGASARAYAVVALSCPSDADQYEGWDAAKARPTPNSPAWFRVGYLKALYARAVGLRQDEGWAGVTVDFAKLEIKAPSEALRISKGLDATYTATPGEFVDVDLGTFLDCCKPNRVPERVASKQAAIARETEGKRKRIEDAATRRAFAVSESTRNRALAASLQGRDTVSDALAAKLAKDADAHERSIVQIDATLPGAVAALDAVIAEVTAEHDALIQKAAAQQMRYDRS